MTQTLHSPPATTAVPSDAEPAPGGFVASVRRRLTTLASRAWAAPAALCAIAVASTYTRLWALAAPCSRSCAGTSSGLIFDEKYYVNAARVILGWHVPAGSPYASAPPGSDPNSEHPQLGKLLIAAGMRVFGDTPVGWRIASVVAGTIAIVAMYAVARAARASQAVALGAAGVMALDNLALVHGRIATLDIFVVMFMLLAAAAYLRGHPVVAGALLGVGACTKFVAVYLVLFVALLEAGRLTRLRRVDVLSRATLLRVAGRVGGFVCVATIVYIAVLSALDAAVSPYDPDRHVYYTNAFSHTAHMLQFASHQRSLHGPVGIASYPWSWFVGAAPIDYYTLTRTVRSGDTVVSSHNVLAFRGAINPFILYLAIPALFASISRLRTALRDDVDLVAVAWVAATFLPLTAQWLFGHRTSYLYYMLLVLPGIYLATVALFARDGMPRAARWGWVVALVCGCVALYPVRSLHWA